MPGFGNSRVEVEVEGERATLLLNEPARLNPLGKEMLSAIIEAAAWCNDQRGLKVVVVAGRGRAFSAGADVGTIAGQGEEQPPEPRDGPDLGRRMAEAVEGMRAVTIARIHGHCVGGGVVLASACDLRLAGPSARFRIPEVDLGIPLAWGGIHRLVREIGPARTKELVMSCRVFDAAEAERIGFLNRVVEDQELEAEVDALAATLASKSGFALLSTKRQTDAITASMISMETARLDADLFIAGMHDPEGRTKATEYLERLAQRRKR